MSEAGDRGAERRGLIEDARLDSDPREEQQNIESLTEWVSLRTRAGHPPGVPPVASVRQRLMATLGSVDRFAPFFEELQALVGLDLPALKQQLRKIDGAQDAGTGWQQAPFSGVRYLDFTPGPAAAVSEAGLVRVAAGGHFPRHQHITRERACVLEGSLVLGGQTFYPGNVVDSPAGSTHEFTAGPERDLVLIVAHGGIRFGRSR